MFTKIIPLKPSTDCSSKINPVTPTPESRQSAAELPPACAHETRFNEKHSLFTLDTACGKSSHRSHKVASEPNPEKDPRKIYNSLESGVVHSHLLLTTAVAHIEKMAQPSEGGVALRLRHLMQDPRGVWAKDAMRWGKGCGAKGAVGKSGKSGDRAQDPADQAGESKNCVWGVQSEHCAHGENWNS